MQGPVRNESARQSLARHTNYRCARGAATAALVLALACDAPWITSAPQGIAEFEISQSPCELVDPNCQVRPLQQYEHEWVEWVLYSMHLDTPECSIASHRALDALYGGLFFMYNDWAGHNEYGDYHPYNGHVHLNSTYYQSEQGALTVVHEALHAAGYDEGTAQMFETLCWYGT
jgi:hypothetical protein